MRRGRMVLDYCLVIPTKEPKVRFRIRFIADQVIQCHVSFVNCMCLFHVLLLLTEIVDYLTGKWKMNIVHKLLFSVYLIEFKHVRSVNK